MVPCASVSAPSRGRRYRRTHLPDPRPRPWRVRRRCRGRPLGLRLGGGLGEQLAAAGRVAQGASGKDGGAVCRLHRASGPGREGRGVGGLRVGEGHALVFGDTSAE